MNFKTHTTKINGKYPYPDTDFILNQLEKGGDLWVTGFHLWDCVQKVAERAYSRGWKTLIDEDLTEALQYRIRDSDFRVDKFLTFNPFAWDDERDKSFSAEFLKARSKPWMWQDYSVSQKIYKPIFFSLGIQ